ncbi:hypothetical protein [Corynebacterium striatum]|uniref:hypothetical protein n=1 Tax=Corynebacterium striatum TaxID=43770 RepID=UPI0027B9989F|nr:hypothetical protein [Corynebacterium striatum]
MAEYWTPGEKAARDRLASLDLSDYDKGRDFPARPATSRLSPHLRWGEVSAREVWQFASALPTDASSFHSELLWRDFAWHRLYHVPDLATEPVREKFRNFDWYWDGGGIDTLTIRSPAARKSSGGACATTHAGDTPGAIL